jgi:pyridoxamine 5'-phosphate oxidase
MHERYGLSGDPWRDFDRWFAEAQAAEPFPANVMAVATVDANGRPSVRNVLLKDAAHGGLCFYTNYESRKGRELGGNPRIAAVFYWPKLERQIRVEGRVERLPRDVAETYFHSRPRGSQLSAAVSNQSRPIKGREELETAAAKLEQELAGRPVPLPKYWGGFKIVPDGFEFWQGLPSRMHDRVAYKLNASGTWETEILAP